MKLCTFCPKGKKCTGHILHTLIMKLYDALESSGNSDDLIRVLSRDEIIALANKGAEANSACWCKSFVLSVSHKFVEIAGYDIPANELREDAKEMIQQMEKLFSRLPKGSSIVLSDLVTEIHNQTCENIKENGSRQTFPINAISQACIAVMQKK